VAAAKVLGVAARLARGVQMVACGTNSVEDHAIIDIAAIAQSHCLSSMITARSRSSEPGPMIIASSRLLVAGSRYSTITPLDRSLHSRACGEMGRASFATTEPLSGRMVAHIACEVLLKGVGQGTAEAASYELIRYAGKELHG